MNAQGEEQVSIVSTKAQAGYVIARDVEETLGELDTISVPGHHGKSVQAFGAAGDSMQPTISPGDLVIGTFTERLDLIQPKLIYVVVTHY